MTPPSVPESWTARATMVSSTVSRSRVELTAWPTSPSAFSSPTDRVSSARPRLQFLEQPHVLDGDDRLVGEGLEQLDLLVGERRATSSRPTAIAPIGTAVAQHGHGEGAAVTERLAERWTVLRVGLHVGYVDNRSLEDDPAVHAPPYWTQREHLPDQLHAFGGDVGVRRQMHELTVVPGDDAE